MIPPFNKPHGNFFIRIGEDLLFKYQEYLKCLLPESINKYEESKEMERDIQDSIITIRTGFQTIKHIFRFFFVNSER